MYLWGIQYIYLRVCLFNSCFLFWKFTLLPFRGERLRAQVGGRKPETRESSWASPSGPPRMPFPGAITGLPQLPAASPESHVSLSPNLPSGVPTPGVSPPMQQSAFFAFA